MALATPLSRRLAVITLLLLAVVSALGLWLFRGEQTAAPPPEAARRPAAAMPPVAGAQPQSQPIDALWKKYEALSRSVPGRADAGAAAMPGTAPGDTAPAPAAVAAAGSSSAASTAAQAQRQQQRAALLAAQREVMQVLRGGEQKDSAQVLAAMETFDQRLREAGLPSVINMDAMRQMLQGADRLRALNAAFKAEADKGAGADARQLQKLAAQISEVQATMPRQVVNQAVIDGAIQRAQH